MNNKREISFSDGIMIYLFAIVANLAMQVILSVVFAIGGAYTGSSDFGQGTYAQLVCMILLQLAFISVPFFYFGANKRAVKMLGAPAAQNNKADVVPCIILPFLAMIGFFLPAQLFEFMLINIGYNPASGVELVTVGQWGLGILAIVIIAPIIEELIFRGFLLGGLKKVFNPYIAALLSAVAFSLMHMNPEQTVYQLFLGYVCALAAIKSNTMIAPVLIHSVSNLLALTAEEPLSLFFNAILSLPAYGVALITVALVLACGAAIFFICYGMGKTRKADNLSESDKAYAGEASGENGDNVNADTASGGENASVQNSAEVAKTESKPRKIRNISKSTGMMIYIGGIGLCLVMWIFVFVMSII